MRDASVGLIIDATQRETVVSLVLIGGPKTRGLVTRERGRGRGTWLRRYGDQGARDEGRCGEGSCTRGLPGLILRGARPHRVKLLNQNISDSTKPFSPSLFVFSRTSLPPRSFPCFQEKHSPDPYSTVRSLCYTAILVRYVILPPGPNPTPPFVSRVISPGLHRNKGMQ